MSVAERKIRTKTESQTRFREEYSEYLAGLPSEIQVMFAYVPVDSLAEHAQFDARQVSSSNPEVVKPSLHNMYHVLGTLECAYRYIAYSDREHDPLNFWDDVDKWEEETGFKYTREELILGIGMGLLDHDKCEIATGWEKSLNGPRLNFREDGYRGRRKLEGYEVPEMMSAEVAVARVGSLPNLDFYAKMRVGALAYQVAMQTTWVQTGELFGYFVRAADRGSGFFNNNPSRDIGACYELFLVNENIIVNPFNEFNFPQTMMPEILPDGVSLHEVLEVVYDGDMPTDTLDIDDRYPNRKMPVGEALELTYKEGIQTLDTRYPQFFEVTVNEDLPVFA